MLTDEIEIQKINKWLSNINITKPDMDIYKKIKNNWDNIAKPIDGLGQFEEVICQIGSVSGEINPDISKRVAVVMCGDNGIVSEGISQSSQEVTFTVASLIGQGKSSVCTLSGTIGTDVIGVDMGIASDECPKGLINMKTRKGTNNFLREPAMTVDDGIKAIESGIEIARLMKERGYQLIATGEMGIGNTTTSTALYCALTGENPKTVTGRGAGLDDAGLNRKTSVIKLGLQKYGYTSRKLENLEHKGADALKILSELGGFDIAGLTGLYIGCAVYHIPVIIDGLISAVAALLAEYMAKGCSAYMIASHSGKEKGVSKVLKLLNKKPLINGDMALGEGTGAVMLIPLLDMASDYYNKGLSFKEYDMDPYKR